MEMRKVSDRCFETATVRYMPRLVRNVAMLAVGLARKEWRAFLALCGFGLEAAWAFIPEGGMPPDGIVEAVDVAAKGDFGLGA